jgi:hypothetical protein
MGGLARPGRQCTDDGDHRVEDGTSCRQASPLPGSTGLTQHRHTNRGAMGHRVTKTGLRASRTAAAARAVPPASRSSTASV